MALIEAVRIQGVERPPPQSLQIRVVMEITQHGRGKPLALMFFQHIDISEMREGRMISDDTRKGYLRTLVINADAVRPGNRSLHKKIGRAHVELQSLMRISYAVFCLKKKKKTQEKHK